MTYAIKVREKDGKSWWFVTPKGHTNRLRIYAGQFSVEAEAQRFADKIRTENDNLLVKVVTL